jgi:hypothetical protein
MSKSVLITEKERKFKKLLPYIIIAVGLFIAHTFPVLRYVCLGLITPFLISNLTRKKFISLYYYVLVILFSLAYMFLKEFNWELLQYVIAHTVSSIYVFWLVKKGEEIRKRI